MIAYLFSAALAALALQHMAYILQYGSIFEPLRDWLGWREASGHWFWGQLYQMVMCQLCCTTQLCLWLWAIPQLILGNIVSDSLGPYLGLVVLWFSEAALALASWDVMRLIGRGSDALILRARREG
jgi:hypothetical protein